MALLKVFRGNACASAYRARRELFASCEMKKPTKGLTDSMLGCIVSGLQFLLHPPYEPAQVASPLDGTFECGTKTGSVLFVHCSLQAALHCSRKGQH